MIRPGLRWVYASCTTCFAWACSSAASGAGGNAWRLHVEAAQSSAYAGEGHGDATDSAGAMLVLRTQRAAEPKSWASIGTSYPADTLRTRPITLSADVRSRDVSGEVTLWLRAEDTRSVVQFENSEEDALTGTSDWTQVRISTHVDPRAVRLHYGLVLSGSGSAEVRHFHIVAGAAPSGPIAPAARALLDTAFALVQANAYWRDTVSWSKVGPDVWLLAAGARTTDDVYPAIRHLLARLGDHHSFVMSPAATAAWRSSRPDTASHSDVQISLLEQHVGYLRMPGFSSGDQGTIRRYESSVHDRLLESLHAASCGWIIDLRANDGGSTPLMLGALEPFLGHASLGAFKGRDGAILRTWHADLAPGVTPPAPLAGLDSAYVAVLTGPKTASAGEAVAIAFRGRARTRSFGEATAGLANANMPVPLPDGGRMQIMVAIDVGRDGHDYGHKVVPEEVIVPQAGGDLALGAARRWLANTSACSAGPAQ